MIELLFMIILIPFLALTYLILFGNKECYECGCRLDKDRRPLCNDKGKRLCENCWLK